MDASQMLERSKQYFEMAVGNEERRICRDVGSRVRSLRRRQNLDQKTLAEIMNTTQSRISQIECGSTEGMTVNTLARLATALGESLSVFIGNEEREQSTDVEAVEHD